jgi:HSP20 family molecular chaperone IbpA
MSFLEQCVSFLSSSSTSSPAAAPFSAVQFSENARFIRLSVDLPGVLNRDLSVEMQRGVLVIRGKRDTELSRGVCHQHTFCRRFALDTDVVDSSKLKANLNRQGVLTVMAPKKSRPTTRQLISVTEQQDQDFERSVVESFVPQKQPQQQEQHKQTAMAGIGNLGDTLDGDYDEEQSTTIAKERENEKDTYCLPEVDQGEPSKKAATASRESLKKDDVSEAPKKRLPMSSDSPPPQAEGTQPGAGKKRSCPPVQLTHKSSLQSHLMIRRSQSNRSVR